VHQHPDGLFASSSSSAAAAAAAAALTTSSGLVRSEDVANKRKLQKKGFVIKIVVIFMVLHHIYVYIRCCIHV
jgi:hypothetical protein